MEPVMMKQSRWQRDTRVHALLVISLSMFMVRETQCAALPNGTGVMAVEDHFDGQKFQFVHENFHEPAVGDVARFQESRSFPLLERNLTMAISNLPGTEVNPTDKARLLESIVRLFNDFKLKKFDELQPVGDKMRRVPYGTINSLVHSTVDNLGLNQSALHAVHSSIHSVFTFAYDENSCHLHFSNHHTGCLEQMGKGGCQKVSHGVDERDRKLILALHNEYRSAVARGDESVNSTVLPAARGMTKMIWDDQLAHLAQAWADQCDFSNDCAECRRTDRLRFVGQNIARFKGLKFFDYKPVWRSVVSSWGSKKNNLPLTDGGVEHFLEHYRHDASWAPYTQIIWDFTYLVGCGFSYFEESNSTGYTQLYVCNYGPAGNMLDSPVYEVGASCGHCPPGHDCEMATKMCSFAAKVTPHVSLEHSQPSSATNGTAPAEGKTADSVLAGPATSTASTSPTALDDAVVMPAKSIEGSFTNDTTAGFGSTPSEQDVTTTSAT